MLLKPKRNRLAVVFAALLLVTLAGVALAEPLNTAFTYQGEISQGGTPLTGTADFQFSLYDAASGGTQVGSTLSINNVTVTGGIFAALLNFGVDVFNGQARYLEISLRAPAGGGVFTTLSPRVTVTPTPYALQTRGIFVDSLENVYIGSTPATMQFSPMRSQAAGGNSKLKVTADGVGDIGMDAEATATTGQSDGVHGKSASSQGRGVVGEADATTGDTKGVHGSSASDAGTGMLGEATATTGDTKGVHGSSASNAGTGMLGEATATTGDTKGVHGSSASNAGTGMLGEATATTGDTKGVHGSSASNAGTGMLGEATATTGDAKGVHGSSASTSGTGMLGEATATTGTTIGVHGKTSSPTGYAGYFEGQTYISGRLGVGTNAPTAMLHIAGVPGTDGIRFPDGTLQTSAASAGASSWQPSGSDIYFNTGNVGVGTSTPVAKLEGSTAGASGMAVSGSATGTGATTGVHGMSSSNQGTGVFGEALSTTGLAMGVRGVSASAGGGRGVVGSHTASGGGSTGIGVYGESSAESGNGVMGFASGGVSAIGVFGQVNAGTAVKGQAMGAGTGVVGTSPAVGVEGSSTGGGVVWGVHGTSMSASSGAAGIRGDGMTGVLGVAGPGGAIGVNGTSAAAGGLGVLGTVTGTGTTIGVQGTSASTSGIGIMGVDSALTGNTQGVYGKSTSTSGIGIMGEAGASTGVNYGVYGKTSSPSGYAGYFVGRGYVGGRLGVGTNAPTAMLHIAGIPGTDGIRFPDGTLQTTALPPGGSQWATYGSNIYYTMGNVGVGTATPLAKLDALAEIGPAIQGATPTSNATAVLGTATGPGATIGVQGSSLYGTGILGQATMTTGVGIGVQGTSVSTSGTGIMGVDSALTGTTKGVYGKSMSSSGIGIQGEVTAITGVNYGVYGKTSSPSGYAGYFEGRGYVGGPLGVGTNAPTAMLHIAGVPGTDGIRFPDGTLQTTALPPGGSQWTTSGSNIYYNNGKIGAGTATPTARIDAVQDTGTAIHAATAGAGATAVSGSATGTGSTVGVLGSGDTGVQGTSATLQGNGVLGLATGGGGIGVFGGSKSYTGVYGSGHDGVRGEGGSDGNGVFGDGAGYGASRGVYGLCLSAASNAVGVLAEGNGVTSPGAPQAAALEVRNGAIVVNGTNRPAGTFQFDAGTVSWTAIVSCENTAGVTAHSHTIGWGTEITLSNPLLKTDSILLLTVQTAAGAPLALYGAYVKSIGTSGSATLEVTRTGVDAAATCATPSGILKLHYLVLNPGSVN